MGQQYHHSQSIEKLRYSSYLAVSGSGLDRKSSPKVRSNRQQMFHKTGAPKNFAKFTRNLWCWSLFSIKLQAFMPGVFLRIFETCKKNFFTENF